MLSLWWKVHFASISLSLSLWPLLKYKINLGSNVCWIQLLNMFQCKNLISWIWHLSFLKKKVIFLIFQILKKIIFFNLLIHFYRKPKMANINQLIRRQSSRDILNRQFSKDIDARLEMSMMGDFYHGRRIHYSGGSFKMRARSKSEVKL